MNACHSVSTRDKLIYIRRTRHSGWLLNVRAMVPNSFKSIESRIDRTLRKKSIPTLNDNNTCSHQTFYYNFDRCSRAEVCRVKVKVNEHQHQLPVWRSFETVHKDLAFTFEPPMGPRVAVGLTMTLSCRQVFRFAIHLVHEMIRLVMFHFRMRLERECRQKYPDTQKDSP